MLSCCFLYIALHILQFLNPVVQNTYKNTIYFTLERGIQSLFILQNARIGQSDSGTRFFNTLKKVKLNICFTVFLFNLFESAFCNKCKFRFVQYILVHTINSTSSS